MANAERNALGTKPLAERRIRRGHPSNRLVASTLEAAGKGLLRDYPNLSSTK
jgi:hypothetical protein